MENICGAKSSGFQDGDMGQVASLTKYEPVASHGAPIYNSFCWTRGYPVRPNCTQNKNAGRWSRVKVSVATMATSWPSKMSAGHCAHAHDGCELCTANCSAYPLEIQVIFACRTLTKSPQPRRQHTEGGRWVFWSFYSRLLGYHPAAYKVAWAKAAQR